MHFADLKNDFVFRRIFGKHPDILRGLLNDLLERRGDQTIETIEYLPSEQLPLVAGAKLSILDVKCRDRSGATFVVEMQLLHIPGFVNRVVYNACKAYVDQLNAGQPYTALADVVAISICDFELWPDAEQDAQKRPRIPMLSRWNMTERGSGNHGLLQVQYVFLELPKLPAHKPETGAELWAWLFVHAPELTEVPAELPPGPHRAAVELANEEAFTPAEREAYRRAFDEIQQARELMNLAATAEERGLAKGFEKGKTEGFEKGKTEGFEKGRLQAMRSALRRVFARRKLELRPEDNARIDACTDLATLERWLEEATVAESAEEALL